jgi:hypothetical protein
VVKVVPFWTIPSGATLGSNAANVGLSNAVEALSMPIAANSSGTFSHPAMLP